MCILLDALIDFRGSQALDEDICQSAQTLSLSKRSFYLIFLRIASLSSKPKFSAKFEQRRKKMPFFVSFSLTILKSVSINQDFMSQFPSKTQDLCKDLTGIQGGLEMMTLNQPSICLKSAMASWSACTLRLSIYELILTVLIEFSSISIAVILDFFNFLAKMKLSTPDPHPTSRTYFDFTRTGIFFYINFSNMMYKFWLVGSHMFFQGQSFWPRASTITPCLLYSKRVTALVSSLRGTSISLLSTPLKFA